MSHYPTLGVCPLCVTLAAGALNPAFPQETYPNRPIRIIVPTAPGAGNDTLARLIAQRLAERWGRQVVVENRIGAGTMIGGEAVAKAPADGYTLLMGLSTLAINPAIYRKMPYDALRDFAPITQAVVVPNLMVVHPSVPVRTVKEMIALAKAQPGKILYASGGLGTNPHFSMALFCTMAQIRMVHVPYKTSGQGIIGVVSGEVPIMAPSMASVISQVRAGKLRALGVTSMQRVETARDISTIAEAGVPGYESVNWYGLLAPAGTPAAIIEKLYKETAAILALPDSKERAAGDGAEIVATSPAEFAAFIKAEIVKWAKVAKAAGITPE